MAGPTRRRSSPNIPFPPRELSLACRAGLPQFRLPVGPWPLAPTAASRRARHSTGHTGAEPQPTQPPHKSQRTRLRGACAALPVPAAATPGVGGPRVVSRRQWSWGPLRTAPDEAGTTDLLWHARARLLLRRRRDGPRSPQVRGIFIGAGYILGIIPCEMRSAIQNQ